MKTLKVYFVMHGSRLNKVEGVLVGVVNLFEYIFLCLQDWPYNIPKSYNYETLILLCDNCSIYIIYSSSSSLY